MKLALAILGLFLAYRWLRSRPDDVVSVDAIARVEARLRLGEPIPKADAEEVARYREKYCQPSRPKVAKFYRPEHRHWRVG